MVPNHATHHICSEKQIIGAQVILNLEDSLNTCLGHDKHTQSVTSNR